MVVTRSKEKKFFLDLKRNKKTCCGGSDDQIEARGRYFNIPECCIASFIKVRKDVRHRTKFRGRWPRSFEKQILVALDGWRLCQQCTYCISREDLIFTDYDFITIQ